MEKLWELQTKVPPEFVNQFPEYSPVALQILWSRNLRTQKEIDEFFSPDYNEDLHDPFLFKGMKKAVGRIKTAVEKKEKILIYGDYDHDGICGSAILYLFFRELGLTTDIYIPDRLKDGYGLNMRAIDEIIKRGINVLITVDCGVSDYNEVKKASEAGIDIIILDHHLIHGKLPPAFAIINAKQKGDRYPFKELAGVGVAFKFVQAIIRDEYIQKLLEDPRLPCIIPQESVRGLISGKSPDSIGAQKTSVRSAFSEKWFLDLVAIGTVGDIVPLVGENRTLVKYGIVVLPQTRRLGLRALMDIAGIKPRLQKCQMSNVKCQMLSTNLDTHTLGFIIVPRINAAGRMDHANTAFRLLITDSEEETRVLAKRLNDQNRERQDLVERIYGEVDRKLKDKKLPWVVIEGNKNWSRGVIGLVASRIVDKYNRPSFVFCEEENKSIGSCRSMPAFNLMEAMESCGDLLEEFGGHKTAGGFTVLNRNLSELKKCINNFAKTHIKGEDFTPKIEIDCELQPEDINWEFFEELERFKPFGEANPRSVFLMHDLEIIDLRYVGQNGKHLQIKLKSKNEKVKTEKSFRGIYFNVEEGKKDLKIGDNIDMVFELVTDEWNGMGELRLRIIDLKPCL